MLTVWLQPSVTWLSNLFTAFWCLAKFSCCLALFLPFFLQNTPADILYKMLYNCRYWPQSTNFSYSFTTLDILLSFLIFFLPNLESINSDRKKNISRTSHWKTLLINSLIFLPIIFVYLSKQVKSIYWRNGSS